MAVFDVTTLTDEPFTGSETVGVPDGAGLSLREALGLSGAGDIVRYNSGLAGGTSVLSSSSVNIDHSVTLDGDTNNDGVTDITVQSDAPILSLGTAGVAFVNDGVRFLMDKSGGGSGFNYAVIATADNISFTNDGEIETIGDTSGGLSDRTVGVYFTGDGFSFVNESDGSVVAGGYNALTSGFNSGGYNPTGTSITNHGLLQSSDDVIRISQGTILNTGTIQTTGLAATFGSGRSPDGISAFGEFDPSFVIPLSGLFDITNSASGLIEGVRAGIYLNGGGMIDNAGHIVAEDAALLLQGAGQGSQTTVSILNSGLIESTDAPSFLDERVAAAIAIGEGLGLISASITNSGMIQSANKAINSYVGVTLINEVTGSIISDTDFADDDAIAFQGADYSDFELGASIGFPTVGPGFPLISAQDVTLVGVNTFETPVGTFSTLSGQVPTAGIDGRVLVDAPAVLPLIDFDLTQAAGNIIFQTDGDGAYIFPDEIEVPITGYGVVTLKWLGAQNFAVKSASGAPAYLLPSGLELADNIENAGLIDGDILTGAGEDVVVNDGQIVGLVDLGSDDDQFDGSGALSAQTVNGGKGADSLTGGAFDDSLLGGTSSDTLEGGDGSDTLDGGGAGDVLIGGAGNDTLIGDLGGDNLDGGADNDVLDGGAGFDTLAGGEGDDMLAGGIADDRMFGNDGADTLDGGNRHDFLAGQDGDDQLLGGAGDDEITGGNGNDTVAAGGGEDTVGGGGGDDSISGEAGDDLLNAGAGSDTVDGGNGDDRIAGASDDDSLSGGAGADVVKGNDGNDTVEGGNLNDTLNGGAGNDLLDGGNNDDRLTGANGDDTLIGGAGDDLLFGNTGDDLFRFTVGDGVDTVSDFTAGALSEDVIELSGFGAGLDEFAEVIAAASDVGGDAVIDLGGGQTITLLGVAVGDLHQDDFIFS